MPPSAVAAASETETASAARTVDMTGRGIESLTRMEDRELVEKASKTKQGAKFSALFNGLDVLGSEEKNERSLMARLARSYLGQGQAHASIQSVGAVP